MKTTLKLLMGGFLLINLANSCTQEEKNTSNNNTNNSSNKNNEIAIKDHGTLTLGWGKGRANKPAYLGFYNTTAKAYNTPDESDRTTQSKIDIVFPGDWGSASGKLTICNPAATGAGAAALEYCANWIVKKQTEFIAMPNSFDVRAYENLKFEHQLLSYYTEYKRNSTNWLAGFDVENHKSFMFKTEEGLIGIAYIASVTGLYGNENAQLQLSIKTMSK
jgi:hypothetical protein